MLQNTLMWLVGGAVIASVTLFVKTLFYFKKSEQQDKEFFAHYEKYVKDTDVYKEQFNVVFKDVENIKKIINDVDGRLKKSIVIVSKFNDLEEQYALYLSKLQDHDLFIEALRDCVGVLMLSYRAEEQRKMNEESECEGDGEV